MSATAAEIAAALGGAKRSGGQWMARCPVHPDKTASLSLAAGEGGRLLVYCHAGCAWQTILAELRRRGMLGDGKRRDYRPRPPPERAASPPAARIHAILGRSQAFDGRIAAAYLRGRGLDPEIAHPEAVRFLPAMGTFMPAMVAIVTDFADASRVLGLQFTPVWQDGSRGERTFLRGSKPTGGVVRLVDDAEVTHDLGVAEGVETALAVMTAMRRAGRLVMPVWSALNAGNLASLPVPRGIERLYVYGDNDKSGTGQRATARLAERWRAAGREVFVAPPISGDWNTKAEAA